MCFVRVGLSLSLVLCYTTAALSQTSAKEGKPAQLRVKLPANAKLSIDEQPTKASGPERLFVTPPLQEGKTFAYTLKWTYPSGKILMVRMIIVNCAAGKETVVDLRPGSKDNESSWISYVPTPDVVVDKMLEMAELSARDVIFDLGCGDGRIVATAAKKFGAKGVGIDIDPERIRDSHETVKNAKVENLVEIRQGDALKVPDLSRATVVTTYMLYEFQKKLSPILKKELAPGTRIVAHDFELPADEWTPERTVTVQGPDHEHVLYLYRIGGKK
jgi:uncharacterized protein (TIGR03000 family)